MKYTVNQAAQIVGITRQTIYRHIEQKPITTEQDANGNQIIDASELLRVYGNDIDFNATKSKKHDSKNNDKKLQDVTAHVAKTQLSNEEKEKLIRLEAELEKEKQLKARVEEENEYLKKQLDEEKEERRKTVSLLEDHREKTEGQGSDKWEKLIEKQQENFANQLKTTVKENEKITQAAIKKALEEDRAEQKRRREVAIKKRREEAERRKQIEEENKSFWQKLFG